MLFDRIRYFNKYILNRFMIRFTRSSRGQFAAIRHIGRRSGKSYETPILVVPMGEYFVIALTYGPKVDWYRNLLAAQGTLLWQRKVYAIGDPELIDQTMALSVFPAHERFILRLVGVKHFVRVKATLLSS
jgi:deazaflavin-dependent oxidoreductase (nitroreductase family)